MAAIKKYRKISIAIINKKAFWNSYDHLGRLLVINLIVVLLSITIIGLPFALVGLYAVATKIANYEEIEFRDFWRGIKKYAKTGSLIVGILLLIFLILIANIYFYNGLLRAENPPFLGYLFSGIQGLMLWLSFFFLMYTLYIFPVLCQTETNIKAILKNSFFLLMDNLKVSFYLLISSVLWLILGLGTGVLAFFLSFSVISVIGTTAVREVLAQYRLQGLDEQEESRGFRDLIKPWQD